MSHIITIDGPTASGKSSTAHALAKRLGYYHLNTGLLFRALAYLLMHNGYTLEDLKQIHDADIAPYLDQKRFEYRFDPAGNPVVLFDGVNITAHLKSAVVDQGASTVALNATVQEALRSIARRIANNYSLVADGRDCGSVTFSYAPVKFFLTAPVDVRAQRWLNAQQARAETVVTLAQAVEQVTLRDKRDSERAAAPLRIPQGGIIVDNSGMSLEETVTKMLNLIKANS